MFEKTVKSAFEKISKDKEDTKNFYILTHKKHRREIYFEERDYKAIKFMKMKFPLFFKRVFYYLLRFGFAEPFLRIIRLPSDLGSLVFAAGQIKIFNFEKNEVISFLVPKEGTKEKFLENKKFQENMGKLGFAPLIYEINKKRFFSREELVYQLKGGSLEKIFLRLIEYYNKNKKTENMQSEKYIHKLKDDLIERGVRDSFILGILSRLGKKPIELLITKIHGDFAPGQVLQKGSKILFVDWDPSTNLITEDFSNFFRDDINLLSKKTRGVLKLYPKEVQRNIAYYLILGEIYNVTIKPFYLKPAKKKIKRLLRHLF